MAKQFSSYLIGLIILLLLIVSVTIRAASANTEYDTNIETLSFISLHDHFFDLFLLDLRTSHILNLTQTPQMHEVDPVWSSDGEWLVFSRCVHSLRDYGVSGCEIYKMRPGEIPIALTRNSSQYQHETGTRKPTWSPDDNLIAYTHYFNTIYHLFVMNADGSNGHELNTTLLYPEYAWSPDSRLIAAQSGRSIEIISVETGRTVMVYAGDAYSGSPFLMVWSPDGAYLAFTSTITPGGDYELFVMDTISGEVRMLTQGAGRIDKIVWQPDSQHIVFSGDFDRDNGIRWYELYTVNVEDQTIQRSYDVTLRRGTPTTWSPDQTQFALVDVKASGFPRTDEADLNLWVLDEPAPRFIRTLATGIGDLSWRP